MTCISYFFAQDNNETLYTGMYATIYRNKIPISIEK